MAKKTDDIVITPEDGWVFIEVSTGVGFLTEIRKGEGHYRFGASSTSLGTKITVNDTITTDEGFYVKAITNECVVTVTREE